MLSWITIAGFVPISLYVSICFCSTCVTIQHLPLRLATGQRPSRRVHQRAWKRRYCEHCSSSHCDTFHACQRRSPPSVCTCYLQVQKLVEMGFPEDQVRSALKSVDGDENMALEKLCSGSGWTILLGPIHEQLYISQCLLMLLLSHFI